MKANKLSLILAVLLPVAGFAGGVSNPAGVTSVNGNTGAVTGAQAVYQAAIAPVSVSSSGAISSGQAGMPGSVVIIDGAGISQTQMSATLGYGYHMAAAGVVSWGSGSGLDGSLDLQFLRVGSHALKLTDGSTGFGSLSLGNLTASGYISYAPGKAIYPRLMSDAPDWYLGYYNNSGYNFGAGSAGGEFRFGKGSSVSDFTSTAKIDSATGSMLLSGSLTVGGNVILNPGALFLGDGNGQAYMLGSAGVIWVYGNFTASGSGTFGPGGNVLHILATKPTANGAGSPNDAWIDTTNKKLVVFTGTATAAEGSGTWSQVLLTTYVP